MSVLGIVPNKKGSAARFLMWNQTAPIFGRGPAECGGGRSDASRCGGTRSTETLFLSLSNGSKGRHTATEFIGRFMRHVLPKGFRKLRSYGILAGANKAAKIAAARELLGPAELPEDLAESPDSTTEDPTRCPECEIGTMRIGAAIPRERPPPVVMPWNRPAIPEAA